MRSHDLVVLLDLTLYGQLSGLRSKATPLVDVGRYELSCFDDIDGDICA
jgi:hypothetical protein